MKILAINLSNLDLSYFTKRGLDFEVEHINSGLQFPDKFLYTMEGMDFYTPDIHSYVSNLKDYAFVLYGYQTSNPLYKYTGGYAFHTPTKNNIFWATVRKDGNESRYAVHELHHLLCHSINIFLKDTTPKDFMDYTPVGNPPVWINYYKNNEPEALDGNHAKTWANIVPFIPRLENFYKPPEMPTVILKRAYSNGKQQLGDLITDSFTCKTLELAWKNNATNISCIPVGEYLCEWTFSPKFMRYTYEVKNVPKRSGIRFHTANFFFSLNGCIALGTHYGDLNKDDSADLINSSITMDKFNKLMNKKTFKLKII